MIRDVKIFISTFIIVLFLQSCYKEAIIFDSEPSALLELPLILKFDDKDCMFDSEMNLLRYPISSDSILNFSPFTEFQESS